MENAMKADNRKVDRMYHAERVMEKVDDDEVDDLVLWVVEEEPLA